MEKFIIISDSFKGTLSSSEIGNIFYDESKKIFPNVEVEKLEIADGGEGTYLTVSKYLNGKIIPIKVEDADLNFVDTEYFISSDNVAYIDVSSCCSLPKCKSFNPSITTTKGIGTMIKDAILKGCKKICLGLGGSSTNDFGLGIITQLGGKFYNENKEEFIPVGNNISSIKSFDFTKLNNMIKDIEFIGLSDVKNPLVGENGCSLVYSLQKGATLKLAKEMDAGILKFTDLLHSKGFKNINMEKGAGAAGGIGGCILQFLNGKLINGIDYILDLIDFDSRLKNADIVFTGEGHLDNQSSQGKVVDGITSRCEKANVAVVAIVGGENLSDDNPLSNKLYSVVTTTRELIKKKELKQHAGEYYRKAVYNTLKLIKLGNKLK